MTSESDPIRPCVPRFGNAIDRGFLSRILTNFEMRWAAATTFLEAVGFYTAWMVTAVAVLYKATVFFDMGDVVRAGRD